MKQLVMAVLNSKLTARCGYTTNCTRVCKFPRQRGMIMKPSSVSVYFVAVRIGGRLLLFMRPAYYSGIISSRFKLMPAHVLKRQTTVFMIVVKMSDDIQSLYAGMDAIATLVGIEANSKNLGFGTVISFEPWVAGLRSSSLNKAHDCGVSDSLRVAPIGICVLRTVCGADSASRASYGKIKLLKALVVRHFFFSFSGPVRHLDLSKRRAYVVPKRKK